MKRSLLIFSFVLAIASAIQAQTWDEANALYADGKYREAAEVYTQILELAPDADVYFNLGNAYFKCGETAQAILAYERCLRLDPRHKDARFNLDFARTRITDNLDDKQTFFLLKGARWLSERLSESVWLLLCISAFAAFLGMLMLFFFSRSLALRKTAFALAIVLLLTSLVAFSCGLRLHTRDSYREEAIVVQGVVNVKASPDKSGTDLFVLHEGTKVRITDTLGEWCEIHAGDNIGWVRLKAVERI